MLIFAAAKLDIQIADFVGVSLDEAPARRDRSAHQHIEGLIAAAASSIAT